MSNLNSVLVAISHPTRRAILGRLAGGPARISDVATPFAMSLTGFCKHVRILEKAGLVRRTRHGRENTLQLSAAPLRDVMQWTLKYQRFWADRMDRLQDYFLAKQEKSK